MTELDEFGFQKPPLTEEQLTQLLDRVGELTSALLDDRLDEEHLRELEAMLQQSPDARSQYVGIMQLHGDLLDYYRPKDQRWNPVAALPEMNVWPNFPRTEQSAE